MPKVVLMLNRFTCSNLGDQEIADCYESFLAKNYDVTVIRADYTSRRVRSLGVNAPLRYRSIKTFIKNIIPARLVWVSNLWRVLGTVKKSRADLVLIGGGQLIMPGVFCLAAFSWVAVSKLFGTKVVMANVGAGGNFDKFDRWLIRATMSRLDGVSFRDKISCNTVTSIYTRGLSKYRMSSDIVYTKDIEKPIIGARSNLAIGVTDWSVFLLHGGSGSREEYFIKWIQLLLEERQDNENVSLIYATAEDYKETLLFRLFAKNNYNVICEMAEIKNTADLRYILSSTRLLVSGRMHSLLIAEQSGCSFRPFLISEKIESFYADLLKLGLHDLQQHATSSTLEFLDPYLNR